MSSTLGKQFLRTAIEDGFLVDVEISNLNSMSLDYSARKSVL